MAAAALVRKYLLNLDTHMDYPDADHWILSYGQLNAVMQWSENLDYYALAHACGCYSGQWLPW